MYNVFFHEGSWIVHTAEIELGFSRESGMLTVLRRPDGVNYLNIGGVAPSLDVQLTGSWLGETAFPRYLSHTLSELGGAVALTINVGLGMLRISDTFRITGTLVARSVAVTNTGTVEQQVHWVRLSLPLARVGSLSEGRFEAPSNSFRPRLAVETVSRMRRDVLPTRDLAPAVRRGRPFENAPDRGPGLLALHSTSEAENLLCWYWSREQTAWPDVDGNDQALTIGHELEIAGWLPAGATLGGGTQYFMFIAGTWNDAMRAFSNTWSIVDVHSVYDAPGWVHRAAIYEVHPGLWGGFRGLTAALEQIRDLGCDTLNIMPIWRYDNRSGAAWDMNWAASGSPYAVLDFDELEPTLGTPAEFRALVDRAHELGLRVLCDLVVQGCGRTARYVTEHPGWFCRNERGRLVSSHGWNDTYSFDWANPDVQNFFVDWTTRFVQTYNTDGWRVDAPHRKEPNWDRRLERSASSTSFGVLAIVERMRASLREINPDAVLLCELYGPLFTTNHDFAYDYLAHLMFFHAGLGTLSSYELGEWLEDHFLALPRNTVRVCFTETHDTRDVNPIADAVRGSRLARMLLVGIIGCGFVPMFWTGQEVGQERLLRRLLRLRQEQRALRDGTVACNTVPCDVPAVWSVVRTWGDERVGVFLNLGPHRRTATISLPIDRLGLPEGEYHFYDLLAERVLSEAGQQTWRREEMLNMPLTVEPFDALVLEIRFGPAPAEPLAVAVTPELELLPE
jgi:glycosidase